MEILLSLATLIIIALIAMHYSGPYSELDFVAIMTTFFASVLLGLALIFIPINRMSVRAGIAEFNAVRESRGLASGTPVIEAAAWRMLVAKSNAWLASQRYYNRTVLDLWIPDEVESLQPIQ